MFWHFKNPEPTLEGSAPQHRLYDKGQEDVRFTEVYRNPAQLPNIGYMTKVRKM